MFARSVLCQFFSRFDVPYACCLPLNLFFYICARILLCIRRRLSHRILQHVQLLMYLHQLADRDIPLISHSLSPLAVLRSRFASALLRLIRLIIRICRLLRLRQLCVLDSFRLTFRLCRGFFLWICLRLLPCLRFISGLLRLHTVIQDIQIERASKDLRDHTHISLLKIIPAQPLCHILTGHLLAGTPFNLPGKLFNRHILTAQNNLDLFSKC